MSKETKMAFEGLMYYGTAGSTATNLLTNIRDVTITQSTQKGDTTPRGSGSSPPVGSQRITRADIQLQFTMLNRSDDTYLAAMLAAAAACTPVALRGKDHSSGKGPDMDFILAVENGQPVNGEQTYKFTADPTEESGRTPAIDKIYC